MSRDHSVKLRLRHTTSYSYSEPVSISFHQAYLRPRETDWQNVGDSQITITPPPAGSSDRLDYFGNQVMNFTIGESHTKLRVEASHTTEIRPRPRIEVGSSGAWEEAAAQTELLARSPELRVAEFRFPSQHVPWMEELAKYAKPDFPAGCPLLKGVRALTNRIHDDFKYDPTATTISTPVDEVLRLKSGVCQDLAHLMIGCLRSIGLGARYVSGYLVPRKGIVGAQASHAWVSVYSPDHGWVDFDPTNDLMPDQGHVTLAWGRDYFDVSPLRGVVLGGSEHSVTVDVKITSDGGGS